MTPRQLQICRRLHHECSGWPPTTRVPVEAGMVIELLNLVWAQTQAIDVAQATFNAEDRLEQILQLPAGSLPAASLSKAGERRLPSAPPRQLTFADAPPTTEHLLG